MDREKVVKGLENCKEGGSCDGCQYDLQSARCIFHLHADALALLKDLLKEQEAVKVQYTAGDNKIPLKW